MGRRAGYRDSDASAPRRASSAPREQGNCKAAEGGGKPGTPLPRSAAASRRPRRNPSSAFQPTAGPSSALRSGRHSSNRFRRFDRVTSEVPPIAALPRPALDSAVRETLHRGSLKCGEAERGIESQGPQGRHCRSGSTLYALRSRNDTMPHTSAVLAIAACFFIPALWGWFVHWLVFRLWPRSPSQDGSSDGRPEAEPMSADVLDFQI